MITLIQDGLQNNALRAPGKTALVCSGLRLTYGELNATANKLANALLDHGLQRGDRVAIFLPNCAEAVAAIYAVLKAGGTFIVIRDSTKADKLTYILRDSGAACLITTDQVVYDGTLTQVRARLDSPLTAVIVGDGFLESDDQLSYSSVCRSYPETQPKIRTIDLDLACLVYTSGSTGEPKGVMCDHSNVVFAAQSIIKYLENTEDDIVCSVLPLSFDYGLYQALMTGMFGGTLVLESAFAYPGVVLQRLKAENVTGFPGVPSIFAALLRVDLRRVSLPALRYITNTAASLPVEHIRQIRRYFPDVKIYSMYGLTETKRTLYLPPDKLDERPGSVGIAIPGTEVWLSDENGNRLDCNSTGELMVRGRHVMRGYWQAPEATADRFMTGPHGERICRTGDLFRMDRDGYLYFIGRKDDIIKTRGEKVAPKEVESVLYRFPGVLEAAVVGVADQMLGQAIKAVLVRDSEHVTKAAIIAHCRAHLEDFMVPKFVEFRDELPTTASGKVSTRELASCVESPVS